VFHGIHSYQNGELGRLRGVLWAAGHDSNGIQHTMYISIEYLSSRHLRLTPRVLDSQSARVVLSEKGARSACIFGPSRGPDATFD
jgi:hypothetical protein